MEQGSDTDDESPTKISIPETPSPLMPKKMMQVADMDSSFDIAENVFCSLPPSKKRLAMNHENTTKVKKKLVNKEISNSASSKSSSHEQRNVKMNALHSKANHTHIAKTNPKRNSAVRIPNNGSSQQIPSSSSEDSDEDIPLLQRIQTKNKGRRNGALSGFRNDIKKSLVKNHVKDTTESCVRTSGADESDPQNQMLFPKRNISKLSVSQSKRAKLDDTEKDKCSVRNSRIKETRNPNHFTAENNFVVGRIREEPVRNSCMLANQKNHERPKIAKTSSHGVSAQGEAKQKNLSAIASTSSRDLESNPGTSRKLGMMKAKKKSPPNTVRNHTNNAIHKQIKDIFGPDSDESENEFLPTQDRTPVKNNRKIPVSSMVLKKNENKSRKKQILSDSSDTEPENSIPKPKSKGKCKSSKGKGREHKSDSSDTEPDVSVLPTTSKGHNSSNGPERDRASSDSTDTEPDVSLVGRRSKEKRASKKAKHKNQKRESADNVEFSDSEVEMMSTTETPSPVFSRMGGHRFSQSPTFHAQGSSVRTNRRLMPSSDPEVSRARINKRKKKVRLGGDDSDSNVIHNPTQSPTSQAQSSSERTNRRRHPSSDSEVLRTRGVNKSKRKVRLGGGDNSDSDVISVEDDVELLHQPEVPSSHRIRLSGRRGRTELGTEWNISHLVQSDDPPSRPSCRYPDATTPLRPTGHGIRGERMRRTPPSSNRRRRQLEDDEQLARDLASRSDQRPETVRSSSERRRRNRQLADDEALARELASGAIGTPREDAALIQVDDDEALARRLQEQFNAEALEEDEPDMTRDTLSVHMPGQVPFTFHYEMGMSSSPHLRPYPNLPRLSTINVSSMMDPIVFGNQDEEEEPPTRRRTRNTRGRGRRGRGRSRRDNSFHVQFFPMDETLDDDYESLWELADRVGPAIQQGLSPEVLSLLPTFRYKPPSEGASQGEENEGKNCTICMMDYEEDDHLRRLPCFHDYHTACIDRWLTDNSSCPVCQTRVSIDDQAVG